MTADRGQSSDHPTGGDGGSGSRRAFLERVVLLAPLGRLLPAQRGRSDVDDGRRIGEDDERAPVIVEDGSARVFRYDLDTRVPADWKDTGPDGTTVWEDDRAVHWVDATVEDPGADRPGLDVTIYQEVVFAADCDGSGIAHPALSPAEWARKPAVSNMDLESWMVLLAADEVKAAFDRVVRQLYGAAAGEPPEKYGVTAADRAALADGTYPGACRIRIVGIDPQQVVTAGDGPLPWRRNGSVTVRVPELPARDWERLSLEAGVAPSVRPHRLVPGWGGILTRPVAVDLAPRRHVGKLVGREPCGRR